MAETDLISVHDALLAAMPDGASHDGCPVCTAAAAEPAKEEADVSDPQGRTFTEAEHFALLTDAVRRETADLVSDKDGLLAEKSDLQSRVDVLEAEKSALTTERDAIKAEFDDFKADLAEKAEAQARTEERLAKVRASADHLPEDYFTTERAARWAQMTDEAFDAALADLAATRPSGIASAVPETAAFSGGQSPAAPGDGSAFSTYLRKRGQK
jgi:chromosome segregation ATPase